MNLILSYVKFMGFTGNFSLALSMFWTQYPGMNLKVKMKLFLYSYHSIFAVPLQVAVTPSIISSNI